MIKWDEDKMTVLSEFDKKAIEAADAINNSIEEKAVDKIGVEFDAKTGYKFSLCNGVYSSQNFLSLLSFVQKLGTVFKDSENLEDFQIRSFQINEKHDSVFHSPFALFNGIAQVVDSNNRVVSIYLVKNGVRSCDGMEGGVYFENENESFPLYSWCDKVFKSQKLYNFYKESKNEIVSLMKSLTNRVEFLEPDGGGYIETIVVSNKNWALTIDSLKNETDEAKVVLPISITNKTTGLSHFYNDPKKAFSGFRRLSAESGQLAEKATKKTNEEWDKLITLNMPVLNGQKDGCFYDKNGDCFVFAKDGNLHRQDGPAVVRFDSEQYWLYGNIVSKEDYDLTRRIIRESILGMGIPLDEKGDPILSDGQKLLITSVKSEARYEWQIKLLSLNELHNEQGPAHIEVVVDKTGPELYTHSNKYYSLNNRRFDSHFEWQKEKERLDWQKLVQKADRKSSTIRRLLEEEPNFTGSVYCDADSVIYFFKNGILHNVDGPSLILHPDNLHNKSYYLYGRGMGVGLWTEFADKLKKLIAKHGDFEVDNERIKFHVYKDASSSVDNRFAIKYFNENGFLHREDGPAVIGDNGAEHFLIKGIPYSKEEFENIKIANKKNKKLDWVKEYLPKDQNGNLLSYKEMLVYQTVPENYTGCIVWLSVDKQEAISVCFYENGKLHNEKSYAAIRADKQNYHYLDGIPCTEHNWRQKVEERREMNKNLFNSKKNYDLPKIKEKLEVLTKENQKNMAAAAAAAKAIEEYYAENPILHDQLTVPPFKEDFKVAKSAIAPGELKTLNYQEIPVKGLVDIETNIFNFSDYYHRLMVDGKITREDAEKSILNAYVKKLSEQARIHCMNSRILTRKEYSNLSFKEMRNCFFIITDENKKVECLSMHDSNANLHNDEGPAYINLTSKEIFYYKSGNLIRNEEVAGLLVKGTLHETPKPSRSDIPVNTLGYIESNISNCLKNYFEKIRTFGSVTPEEKQEFDLNSSLLKLIQIANEKRIKILIVTAEDYYDIDNTHLKENLLLVVVDNNRKVNWAALYDSNGNCHNEDGPAYVDMQTKIVSHLLGGAIIYDVENFKKHVEDYRATDLISFRQKMDNASNKKQIVVADEVRESVMRGLIKQIKRMLVETIADQLANNMPDQTKAKKVAVEMLKTPAGSALFSLAIGSAVPVVAEKFPVEYKKYIEETGKELRISGGADIVYELTDVLASTTSALVSGIKSSFDQLKAHDSRKNNIPVRVEVAKGPIVPVLAPENVDNVYVESDVVQGRKSF